MAEIEISILSRQCFSERKGNIKRLEESVMAGLTQRNSIYAKTDW
jgi:hypothetical protein